MPIGFTRPGKITEAKRQVASKEVAGGGKKVNPVLLSMLAEAASTTMDAMTGGESPVAEADGSYDGKDSKEEDVGALHLALSGLQSYLKALGPAGKKYAFDATEALSSDDAALELYRKLTAAASDAGFLVAAANGPKPPADAKDETTTKEEAAAGPDLRKLLGGTNGTEGAGEGATGGGAGAGAGGGATQGGEREAAGRR